MAFPVKQFLPTGLVGLVLAGLASAIMSTLSAITNSSATIFTLDLYKAIFRPNASDKELHLMGRISGVVVLLIGVAVGLILCVFPGITVFRLIQTVFFYIAPPISACFVVGILWKRATPIAATWTTIIGFLVFLPVTVFVLFPKVPLLQPYDNFMHHTLTVFIFSVISLVILSLFTKPKPIEQLKGVIWTTSALGVAEGEKGQHRRFKSLGMWWFLMVGTIAGLYLFTYLKSSGTDWLEAEDVAYTTTEKATARIQPRNELAGKEKFNLWTGRGQVLFTPSIAGDRITFELPIKKAGHYRIEALITAGTDYGKFSVTVGGVDALITYSVTEVSGEGKYSVVPKENTFFDAGRILGDENDNQISDSIAGEHVVQRIGLGVFSLNEKTVSVSFIAKDIQDGNSLIGIDQFMLTREKE